MFKKRGSEKAEESQEKVEVQKPAQKSSRSYHRVKTVKTEEGASSERGNVLVPSVATGEVLAQPEMEVSEKAVVSSVAEEEAVKADGESTSIKKETVIPDASQENISPKTYVGSLAGSLVLLVLGFGVFIALERRRREK